MTHLARRIVVVVFIAGILGLIAFALWPRPVEVAVTQVQRGTLRVTVNEDGKTRIKEKYVVSAPLAGRLARVVLKQGDSVVSGKTVLAAIDPVDPSLLDPRSQAEALARINAAEAAMERAQADLSRQIAALELAQSDLTRVQSAIERNSATRQELETASTLHLMRTQEVRSATYAREIARFELELARAAMLRTSNTTASSDWRFEITAPVDGRVLRVFKESTDVVQPGTPLIEIGDPADLEVVIDVLSSDGVGIRPGAEVVVEHWGGEHSLHGRVRLVEPSAFTKVSALGVEEQRVNVIVDLIDPIEARSGLGDAFRVETRIVVAEITDTLMVSTGALFRHADSWAVFLLDGGAAVLRNVQIGRRNDADAQIISGLLEGDKVVIYPSDRVRPGTRIVQIRE